MGFSKATHGVLLGDAGEGLGLARARRELGQGVGYGIWGSQWMSGVHTQNSTGEATHYLSLLLTDKKKKTNKIAFGSTHL